MFTLCIIAKLQTYYISGDTVNKKLIKTEIIGFIAVCIVGTLLHFVYKWTGENKFFALFCPVGESPWEHLKLLYFPFLIFTIYERVILNKDKFNVFFANYVGISVGMLLTLNIYYTSLGITGKQISAVNIASFFIGVAAAFIISYIMINSSIGGSLANGICCALFIVDAIIFMLFTFEPPIIPLFQDPQTLQYGI